MERANTSSDDHVKTVENLLDSLVMHGTKTLTDMLAKYDLTVAQFLSMDALQGKGSESSMSDLAIRIQQSSATMTGIIDRLVEKGLVTRRRSDEDRRAVYVSLTSEGHKLLTQVANERRLAITDTLHKISPDETDELIRSLRHYLQVAGYTAPTKSSRH